MFAEQVQILLLVFFLNGELRDGSLRCESEEIFAG
jgi:hypothetical protein